MFLRLCLVLAIVASAGARLLAAEPFDAAALIKQLREPTPIEIDSRELQQVPNRALIHCLDFSPDVKTLCAVQVNGLIITWDVASGKIVSTKKVSGAKVLAAVGEKTDRFVEKFALSRDRSLLAMALRSGDVVFWDVEKGEVVAQLAPELKGKCAGLALTSDGKVALFGRTTPPAVFAVDTQTGHQIFLHDAAETDIIHVAISTDDSLALFTEKDNTCHSYPLLGGMGGNFGIPPSQSIGAFKGMDRGAGFITSRNELYLMRSNGAIPLAMRTGTPARFVASVEGRHFVIYDAQGNLELRRLETAGECWHHNFAADRPSMYSVGSDGRTLALVNQDGVLIKRLSAVPESSRTRAGRELQKLLTDENYAALKAIARQLTKEQDQPFPWHPLYPPLDVVIANLGDADALPELEKWAASDKDELLPKLLLANAYIRTAWAHRGGGFAATVTREGWLGFRENIIKARELLTPLCEQDDAPAPARSLLLTVAMAESWGQDEWMPHVDWVLKNSPSYSQAYQQAVQMLLPRWGGQPGESARFAASVADTIGGAAGDAMYARIWLANYDLHGQHPSIVTEMGMDKERVARGLVHLADKSANPTYFAHRGLRLAFLWRNKAATKEFLSKLKDPMNTWELSWWQQPAELAAAIKYASEP